MSPLVAFDNIRARILVLRGHRVVLSGDLAELYGVEPKVLVQAVRRNVARFPADFMFEMTRDEWSRLRSQIVTLDSLGRGAGRGRYAKYPPLAFTEHGVTMLSSVLRSARAIDVNIQVVRAFVHLRQSLMGNHELSRKVAELEKRYDGQFKIVFEALQELMAPEAPTPRKQIGFQR